MVNYFKKLLEKFIEFLKYKFFSNDKYDNFINDLYNEDILTDNDIDMIQNNKNNDKSDDFVIILYRWCTLNIYKSLNEITKYIDANLEEKVNYEVLAKMLVVNVYTMESVKNFV